ncbi:DUF3173 family protein [Enterococcus sp. LJL98]
MKFIKKEDLMDLGYTKSTSQGIIRQAKATLVSQGFEFYNNRRLGLVPAHAVKAIIGVELSNKEDN